MPRSSRARRLGVFSIALASAWAGAVPAGAASITYGEFGPVGDLAFVDVGESSATDAVPLFGEPDAVEQGFEGLPGLDFAPGSFEAAGEGGDTDVTSGELTLTIRGRDGIGIAYVLLFESGDYTLAGEGGDLTAVLASATMQATIVEIDGVAVTPVALGPASASVAFDLSAQGATTQPWSLQLGLGVPGQNGQRVTAIELVIDDELMALSDPEGSARIVKDEVRLGVAPFVPEPSALVLLAAGVLGTCGARALGLGRFAQRNESAASGRP